MLLGLVAVTGRFQAQLFYVGLISMQLSLKPASYGHLPQQPRREPYFLSSKMLYLTSQRTKLSRVWLFGVLIITKDHRKNNGAKRASGWRNMQIHALFPTEGTYLGHRYTTCAFKSCHSCAGRLN